MQFFGGNNSLLSTKNQYSISTSRDKWMYLLTSSQGGRGLFGKISRNKCREWNPILKQFFFFLYIGFRFVKHCRTRRNCSATHMQSTFTILLYYALRLYICCQFRQQSDWELKWSGFRDRKSPTYHLPIMQFEKIKYAVRKKKRKKNRWPNAFRVCQQFALRWIWAYLFVLYRLFFFCPRFWLRINSKRISFWCGLHTHLNLWIYAKMPFVINLDSLIRFGTKKVLVSGF